MENLILKTGFDNVESNDDSQEIQLQMSALVTVFMENAIKNAEIYSKHANRKTITSLDISISLKKELFTFLSNDDIEARAKNIYEEFKKEIEDEKYDEEDEEYDEEDEEYDEEDEEYEEDDEEYEDDKKKCNEINNKEENYAETEEIFTKSMCSCNVCILTNKYADQWKKWKPSNRIEEILSNSINKIDSKFNLKFEN